MLELVRVREPRTWRLSLIVPRLHLPPFEDALAEASALATTALPPGTHWRIDALFLEAPDREAWRDRLGAIARGLDLPLPEVRLELLAETDWVAESLRNLAPVRAGRFFVHGAHDRDRVPTGATGLEIEAGRAFGTGSHETTRGCLLALDALAKRRRYRRVLDLGCGSGVLALAAARLWRRRVLAADIDPRAAWTTAENARRNELGPWVRAYRADGLAHPALRAGGPHDLILANILAGPLHRLAPDLAAALAPRGRLVLSGLLHRQTAWIEASYRQVALVLERRWRLGEWSTLVLRRGARH